MPDPEVSREEAAEWARFKLSEVGPGAVHRLARTCLALYDREDELLCGIAASERKYQAATAEAARMTEKFRAARAERDALTQEVERLRGAIRDAERAIVGDVPARACDADYQLWRALAPLWNAAGSEAVPAGAHDASTEREAEITRLSADLSTYKGIVKRLLDGWRAHDDDWWRLRAFSGGWVDAESPEPMSEDEIRLLREVGNA
jgi:hypothetical protein